MHGEVHVEGEEKEQEQDRACNSDVGGKVKQLRLSTGMSNVFSNTHPHATSTMNLHR